MSTIFNLQLLLFETDAICNKKTIEMKIEIFQQVLLANFKILKLYIVQPEQNTFLIYFIGDFFTIFIFIF